MAKATAATKPVDEVKPVDEAKAEEFKDRAEADFDPAETAQKRLERLTKETEKTLKEARAAARAEVKKERDAEESTVLAPIAEQITKLLAEAEEKTGKIFRNFSFYYKFKKDAEKSDVKTTHSLVTARGESTEDEDEESTEAE